MPRRHGHLAGWRVALRVGVSSWGLSGCFLPECRLPAVRDFDLIVDEPVLAVDLLDGETLSGDCDVVCVRVAERVLAEAPWPVESVRDCAAVSYPAEEVDTGAALSVKGRVTCTVRFGPSCR